MKRNRIMRKVFSLLLLSFIVVPQISNYKESTSRFNIYENRIQLQNNSSGLDVGKAD
ncbi:PhrA family quorum-sensing system peptide [Streptococcus dysgalactiae]|uniref:PhrA family quorum-sensing system peptide n=1 Tax=Streptococcus dysgalactiae TaxID=1334 RepID=UPI00353275F9